MRKKKSIKKNFHSLPWATRSTWPSQSQSQSAKGQKTKEKERQLAEPMNKKPVTDKGRKQ